MKLLLAALAAAAAALEPGAKPAFVEKPLVVEFNYSSGFFLFWTGDAVMLGGSRLYEASALGHLTTLSTDKSVLSPDRKRLAVTTHWDTNGDEKLNWNDRTVLWIADMNTSAKRRVTPVEDDLLYFEWSPDSKRVAVGLRHRGGVLLRFYDVAAKTLGEPVTYDGEPLDASAYGGRWLGDGKRYAVIAGGPELSPLRGKLMAAGDGSPAREIGDRPVAEGGYGRWSASPDGATVFFPADSGWRTAKADPAGESSPILDRLPPEAGRVLQVTSVAGRPGLVFSAETDKGKRLYRSSLDGSDAAELAEATGGTEGNATHPAWSPDGTRLAFAFAPKSKHGARELRVVKLPKP